MKFEIMMLAVVGLAAVAGVSAEENCYSQMELACRNLQDTGKWEAAASWP